MTAGGGAGPIDQKVRAKARLAPPGSGPAPTVVVVPDGPLVSSRGQVMKLAPK